MQVLTDCFLIKKLHWCTHKINMYVLRKSQKFDKNLPFSFDDTEGSKISKIFFLATFHHHF